MNENTDSLFSQVGGIISSIGKAVSDTYTQATSANNQLQLQNQRNNTILIVGVVVVAIVLLKK